MKRMTFTDLCLSVVCSFAISIVMIYVVYSIFDPYNKINAAEVETADWNEVAWSKHLAKTVNGKAEYRLPDKSRVDILTETTAWEVEWEDKWEEAVGQSLFYSLATQKQPGIWILRRKSPKDDEDYLRVLAVYVYLKSKGVPMKLRITQTGNPVEETVEASVEDSAVILDKVK